jgi:hypothetical protein
MQTLCQTPIKEPKSTIGQVITQYGQSTCPSDQMTFHRLDTSVAEYQSDAEISFDYEIAKYIDTCLTKDVSTKSYSRVLPSIAANSTSSNSLIKLDNLVLGSLLYRYPSLSYLQNQWR